MINSDCKISSRRGNEAEKVGEHLPAQPPEDPVSYQSIEGAAPADVDARDSRP
jgi:hypothetical protein